MTSAVLVTKTRVDASMHQLIQAFGLIVVEERPIYR